MRLTILIIALVFKVGAANPASAIRGVHPSSAVIYQQAIKFGSFRCLDGLKEIAAAAINDNYCDCSDGSDEPGSSACPGGSFYCRNRGHQARNLSATFVDDGICDCCDGSDEPAGECASTCLQQGAAARKELMASAQVAAAGHKVRQQIVRDAITERQSMTTQLKTLKMQIAEAQPEVNRLLGIKEAAEKVAKRLKEQHEAAEARVKKTKPATPEPNTDQEVVTINEQVNEAAEKASPQAGDADTTDSGSQEAAVLPSDAPQDTGEAITQQTGNNDITASQEAVAKSDEERAKETMAQWVKRDDASQAAAADDVSKEDKSPDQDGELEEAVEEVGHTGPTDVESDAGGPVADQSEVAAPAVGSLMSRAVNWAANLLKRAPSLVSPSELDKKEQEAHTASSQYNERNRQLEALVSKQTELESKSKLDFGPEDVFLPLHGKCFSVDVDKYVYEACPYREASQKEGGGFTSLGHFARFDDNYTSMVFENGQGCWQGPNRSFRVALTCGIQPVLSAVSEPSRCVYTAKLSTPALCTAQHLADLEAAVTAAQAELNEAQHDEL